MIDNGVVGWKGEKDVRDIPRPGILVSTRWHDLARSWYSAISSIRR